MLFVHICIRYFCGLILQIVYTHMYMPHDSPQTKLYRNLQDMNTLTSQAQEPHCLVGKVDMECFVVCKFQLDILK